MQRMSIAWTRILPAHFRGRGLEKLNEHLRNTTLEPLHIHALLPWPANHVYGESFNDVASMLHKHVHRLKSLHIRAVTPELIGPFLKHTLFSTNHRVVASLEELDVAVKLDSDDQRLNDHRPQMASVLQDAGETLPSLKSLTLPGYHECIPIPTSSSVFTNLTQLRVNGTGLGNGSPLYNLLRFLHHTPNLEFLFYKTPDQFSYQLGRTPPEGSWTIGKKDIPVSIPVSLPRLCVGDVSASGSGTDLLRNISAPNLEHVHMDGSRNQDRLEDWHIGLIDDVGDVLAEISRRSPDIRSITLTEMPLEERVFKWLLGGEPFVYTEMPPEEPTIKQLLRKLQGTAAVKPTTSMPHFRKLEELIVRDMEMTKDQAEDLSVNDRKGEWKVELTDGALAQYASNADSVTLKKLGIHRAKRLSPDVILAVGRKGVRDLAQHGVTTPFVMEFMQNQGPPTECLDELGKIGVKVEWTEEAEGSDTDRRGWWTNDFKIDDCYYLN